MPSNSNILRDKNVCPAFTTLAFSLTSGINTQKFYALLDHYGPDLTCPDNAAVEKAHKELALAASHNITIIPITSPDYPQSLKILADAPLVLYVKGPLAPTDAQKVAIVGTRAASHWGMECTRCFAKQLSELGVWIISGLARGIDTAAHNASIGKTCAFIGSGLLHIYPKENEALADTITVISELPLYTAPTRFSFPKRNRLISAYSDAILLTEAPIKSGAMITMNLGEKHNKPLFTVPGRAMNESYAGNHSLIKTQKATMVESPQELAAKMGLFCPKKPQNAVKTILISPSEQKILDFLYQSEVSLDELSVKICLPISILQVSLTKLVLRKLAEELPGKRYKYIG